jgi:hypothetical protein
MLVVPVVMAHLVITVEAVEVVLEALVPAQQQLLELAVLVIHPAAMVVMVV